MRIYFVFLHPALVLLVRTTGITCVSIPSPPGLLLHFPVSVHVVYCTTPPKKKFQKDISA